MSNILTVSDTFIKDLITTKRLIPKLDYIVNNTKIIMTKNLYFYLDQTNGSDLNDGLSVEYPKKSLISIRQDLNIKYDVCNFSTVINFMSDYTFTEDDNNCYLLSTFNIKTLIFQKYSGLTNNPVITNDKNNLLLQCYYLNEISFINLTFSVSPIQENSYLLYCYRTRVNLNNVTVINNTNIKCNAIGMIGNGYLTILNNITLKGKYLNIFAIQRNSTLTLSGNLTYNNVTANCNIQLLGNCYCELSTNTVFSGTLTGKKYVINGCSCLNSQGGIVLGTETGTSSNGSFYI